MGGSNSAEAPKEDEDPPVNVDTGDSVKVKQTLDEAVVKAVLDHGYEEHHTLDNAKLLLMLVAMTMNLGLFGSVLGGYFVGDALFLSRAPRPPSGHGPMNVDACCA